MTSISKIRSGLYKTARVLGDVNAVEKSVETESLKPIGRRAFNKLYGRLVGRGYRR